MHCLFVVCQHFEDDAFWRGDLASCAKLQGVDSCELEEEDFPLVRLRGVAADTAVRIGMRSCAIKEVIECDPMRYRSLDALRSQIKGEVRPNCVVHHLGQKPSDFPDLADIRPLLRSSDVWVVRSSDGAWTLRQGRVVANSSRDLIAKYSLKQRTYLGPTSLSSEMALLMANQCLARRGMLVLDPYVGTGGGLVGAVHFGAVAIGAEIDWRMVEGAEGNKTFRQYGLPCPDIVRGDFSSQGRVLWGNKGVFDAVVGDPPYGVRAGARKTGLKKKKDDDASAPARDLSVYETHIPPTQPYSGDEVMRDLIDASRELLVPGGRLVFLFPVETRTWAQVGSGALPAHDGFRLVNTAEQKMRSGLSRILVTLEKSTDTDARKKAKDGESNV